MVRDTWSIINNQASGDLLIISESCLAPHPAAWVALACLLTSAISPALATTGASFPCGAGRAAAPGCAGSDPCWAPRQSACAALGALVVLRCIARVASLRFEHCAKAATCLQDAVARSAKFLVMYKRPGQRVMINSKGELDLPDAIPPPSPPHPAFVQVRFT